MKLGLYLGYWGAGSSLDMDLVLEAERLGYDSVWAAEAWGSDAITVLSWIGARTESIALGSAILQIPARTPAMTAMTAVTLSRLSGGRFRLGLGPSGPQVVEGWHGTPYGKPLERTREYVSIVRRIFAREERLEHSGEHYQIPYRGPGSTGLGRPLKILTRAPHDIPIYVASLGPRFVRLTAEIADGWLPVLFSPAHAGTVFGPSLRAGFEASGDGAKRSRFDIAPQAPVVVAADVAAARAALKPTVALYIGGMGTAQRNFYKDLVCRYGFEKEATKVQRLYLEGSRREAAAEIPDALVDAIALVGPPEAINDQLDRWRAADVDTLLVSTKDLTALRLMAQLLA